MEGWAKIKPASRYAGVSERTFRPWLKDGLKHSRLPSGTILIRYSAIDEFLERFSNNHNQLDQIVEETMRELMNKR